MKLSATPFHPVTGELLPTYRDAYLRGDLSSKNTEAVDNYLKANSQYGDATLRRYFELNQAGHAVKPIGWVQRQFDLIRTEPQRFRRRAASLVAGSVLVGGAVFAGANLPTAPSENLPTETPTELVEAASAEAAALRMTSVRGRILDENGKPLIGATVLDKSSGRGVTTDASGNYVLPVAANQAPLLQYGYAGYSEEEVQMKGRGTHNVTLLPREAAAKKRRWWQF
ncbi:carboxypeptidase-like regulatory domain-containing protein [Hymenobacter sediminicola]|uniref:Carboxypeptidase-like regulatory domain-containing protein n=1 Tax=Hymenobacter sediminicola TaxID=2761579 RepID=A0A7G7W7K5_9BACT|nr:carboxypeptidase-like regulatory domain-containing protein [Hymenobacter sediminicola]QNH62348.1 carboxypeptidase-like regulatory domain-containing protein [Hymenobacter sediminicola]